MQVSTSCDTTNSQEELKNFDSPLLVWEFPNLVVSNLAFTIFTQKRSFALFCSLLRSFADFRGLAFALFCAHLRVFCV